MRRLLRWLPALLVMAGLFALSHQPGLPLPSPGIVDKFQHAFAYAALMLAFVYALGPVISTRSVLLAAALTILYGAFDELHQSTVAGRHASLADWVADMIGAAVAAALLRRRSFAGLLGLWENSPR